MEVFGRGGDGVGGRSSPRNMLQREAREENVVRELDEDVTRGSRHRPALTGKLVSADDRPRTIHSIPEREHSLRSTFSRDQETDRRTKTYILARLINDDLLSRDRLGECNTATGPLSSTKSQNRNSLSRPTHHKGRPKSDHDAGDAV